MKRVLAGLMSAFAIATFATATVEAQTQCPAEVAKAKEMLNTRTAKADTVQAPRSLAGARDVQAPRGQDVQAPRGQDIQAPRGQDVQAPRGQDVQAPRSLAGSKTTGSKAFNLVKEAEAACAKGDMATAKAKAEAALATMKSLRLSSRSGLQEGDLLEPFVFRYNLTVRSLLGALLVVLVPTLAAGQAASSPQEALLRAKPAVGLVIAEVGGDVAVSCAAAPGTSVAPIPFR